jgi:acylphosphatase
VAVSAGRIAVRAVITGRVQGVWFRAWTVETATRLGLDGWVRNRRDGSVEALFAGPAEAVERMLEACRVGPSRARVDAVARHAAEDDGVAGFRQLPTG